MRGEIILAGIILLTASEAAQAEEWCGYAARAKSLIECGYSSINECESALGKGGRCFVDPEIALNKRPGKLKPAQDAAATTRRVKYL